MSKNGELTEALSLACEMVRIGHLGRTSVAGRVSLVNENGVCVYDVYVKPNKVITDYCNVQSRNLTHGRAFQLVKADVAPLIKGRLLVGHSVGDQLRAMGLSHPPWNVRDVAAYPPFQARRGTPTLKHLVALHLDRVIQERVHSSVVNAKSAMILYKHVETEWEDWLRREREGERVVRETDNTNQNSLWLRRQGEGERVVRETDNTNQNSLFQKMCMTVFCCGK